MIGEPYNPLREKALFKPKSKPQIEPAESIVHTKSSLLVSMLNLLVTITLQSGTDVTVTPLMYQGALYQLTMQVISCRQSVTSLW